MATKKQSSSKSKKIVCNVCGRDRAIQNYYKSSREEYEGMGYCTTCKDCLRKSSVDMNLCMVTKESIKGALKKLDRPLIEEVFVMIKNRGVTNEKFLGDYLSQLNLLVKYKDCTFSDSVDIEIANEKIMNAKVDEEKKQEVTDEMRLFWGKGLANEDYLDLQAKFDRLIENEEYPDSMDYKKELDYKKLVIWEFQLSRIQYDLDKIREASQLQKNIADLSSDLGIKAIQKKEDNSNKGAYDLFIKKIETTRPIFDFERDLGNRDEIKELLQLYFYGYLMDVNNQKTEFTDALYKDIENYTPDVSKVYEYDDEDVE